LDDGLETGKKKGWPGNRQNPEAGIETDMSKARPEDRQNERQV